MNKIYKTKIPASMYIQLITYTFLVLSQLLLAYLVESLIIIVMSTIVALIKAIITLALLTKILKKDNKLEISNDQIKLNNVEIQIIRIEKIIIEGYFIQSIGIKLYGKKYVLNDLHFRFKYDEEKSIEEFKEWAIKNGINVTSGRISRWI